MQTPRDTVNLQELEDRSERAHAKGEYTFYDKQAG